jgi:hypothetical protein
MDANKLKKLKEVSYTVQQTCSLCKHSSFPHKSNWGTCGQFTYDHLKHTDSKRHMSIYRHGTCEGFEENKNETVLINVAYRELTSWIGE